MPFFHHVSRTYKLLENRYVGHPFRLFTATLKGGFALHLFHEFGFTLSPTWGASMLPTFEVTDDWVLISRAYRRGNGVEVGDMITFDSVAEPGQRVIKRVLGLNGDYVLRDTPGESDTMIQVPKGHVYVVGDNLPYSRDSRHFGPVPIALIKGKVIAKVFPWKERRWVTNDLQPVRGN